MLLLAVKSGPGLGHRDGWEEQCKWPIPWSLTSGSSLGTRLSHSLFHCFKRILGRKLEFLSLSVRDSWGGASSLKT